MKAVITNFGAILISLFVKDKKGKGIQIIYGPQVTVIKSGTMSRKRTPKIDKF